MGQTSLELAEKAIVKALEESGGTITSERWSGILMLVEDDEDFDRFDRIARDWRRERNLPPDDDYLVGGIAR